MHTEPRRSGNARGRLVASLLPVLLALGAVPAPAPAQEAEAPANVPLSGQVVDRSTGRPLPGAVVDLDGPGLRAMADEEGRFTFRKVRPGEHRLTASLLGYGDLEQPVQVAAEQGAVRLALTPDPVLLEGLTVKMNVLERRMNRVAVASRAYDREQIRASASPHLAAFVRGPAGVPAVRCTMAFADACLWSRGGYVPVAVYLDEMPIYSLDHLRAVQPEEVERVEVYQHGRQVRVYTSRFMEQVARGKRRLDPVFF